MSDLTGPFPPLSHLLVAAELLQGTRYRPVEVRPITTDCLLSLQPSKPPRLVHSHDPQGPATCSTPPLFTDHLVHAPWSLFSSVFPQPGCRRGSSGPLAIGASIALGLGSSFPPF